MFGLHLHPPTSLNRQKLVREIVAHIQERLDTSALIGDNKKNSLSGLLFDPGICVLREAPHISSLSANYQANYDNLIFANQNQAKLGETTSHHYTVQSRYRAGHVYAAADKSVSVNLLVNWDTVDITNMNIPQISSSPIKIKPSWGRLQATITQSSHVTEQVTFTQLLIRA
ncbi:hypothetical protein J6590_051613 [Homalodisca vitripennis]|nr:hypothetical protein J6590_051613 [Homalodisca vitripennis]